MTIAPVAPALPVPVDLDDAPAGVSLVRTTARKVRPTYGRLAATVSQVDLLGALTFTKRDQNLRMPMQVLNGVLIEAGDDGVTLSRFDFEQLNSETINGAGSGRALVPAALLLDLVKLLDKGPVSLTTRGRVLTVAQDDLQYTLEVANLDDYPALPGAGNVEMVTMTGAQLHGLLPVLVAAGGDQTLPVLTAACFNTSSGTLEVAATDRYRLAVLDTELTAPILPNVLVPAKPLHNLAVALKGAEQVQVLVERVVPPVPLTKSYAGYGKHRRQIPTPRQPARIERIVFRSGSRTISLRTVDGEFPKYGSLMPNDFSARLDADTVSLTKAVKQVAAVCDRNAPVRFDLTESSSVLEAGNATSGSRKKLAGTEFAGVPLTIACNPGFLLDGVKAVGAEVTQIQYVGPTRPFVLSDAARPQFRYLLMPVRISG